MFAQYNTEMKYDSAFIQKLKKGNKKSFEGLFLNTYESLCDYSASITNSKEDAEGIVQDIFASLWTNRHSLDISVNIKAYLFKSAKNRALDIIQHKEIRKKYQDHLTSMYQTSLNNESVSASHIIRRVTEEVEKLPEKCKVVYLLHRRDGLTYSEIAVVLEISKKAVEARMTKALKTLRERLQKEKNLNIIPYLAILGI